MRHRLFQLMACLGLLIVPFLSAAEQHPEEFVGTVTSHVTIHYLLFTPEGYKEAAGFEWRSRDSGKPRA
jgi:hypothetical protein